MDQVFHNAVDQGRNRSCLSHPGLFRELVSWDYARSRCGGHVGQDCYCGHVKYMLEQWLIVKYAWV